MSENNGLVRVYQFSDNHHTVFITAENSDQAIQKFQERFGYHPTIENQEENEHSQADGTSEV